MRRGCRKPCRGWRAWDWSGHSAIRRLRYLQPLSALQAYLVVALLLRGRTGLGLKILAVVADRPLIEGFHPAAANDPFRFYFQEITEFVAEGGQLLDRRGPQEGIAGGL